MLKFDPEKLENAVIELDDEVEYIIDSQAAKDIVKEKPEIKLMRLYDHKIFTFPIKKILDDIANGAIVDKLER